jgi:hypothetical protein
LLSPKTAVLSENVRFLSCFLFLSFMQNIDHTFAYFSCFHPKLLCLVKMLGYKLYLWDHMHLSSHFPEDQGSIEQESR